MAKNDKKVNQEVESLQQQIAELTSALQRERADAINVRRRSEEEKIGLSSYYKANIVRELLPVIDNFERSLNHIPKELETNDFVKGVRSVVNQFEDVMGKIGVKRIPTVDEVFDPSIHEAVSMDDSQGGNTEVVSEELQAGFMLGDEVVRPAMVKVCLKDLPAKDAGQDKKQK